MAELRNLANKYLHWRIEMGSLKRETARHMSFPLFGFAEEVGGKPLTRRTAEAWWRSTNQLAPGTRRNYRSVVNKFCDWLVREGVARRNPIVDIPSPKVPEAVHRCLELDDAQKLLDACKTQRDRLIIVLGLQVGPRVSEIAGIELGHFNWRAKMFRVTGKGGKERWLPITDELERELKAYLRQCPAKAGPLIRRHDGKGGLSRSMLMKLFRTIAYDAGVKVAPHDGVATHSLRHTAATDVFDGMEGDKDPRVVQELLGHVHLATTERYIGTLPISRIAERVNGRCYECGKRPCICNSNN